MRDRLQELDARMKEMKRYRKELGTALAEWDKAGTLDGHICGLIEGTDIESVSPQLRGVRRRVAIKKR